MQLTGFVYANFVHHTVE